MPLTAPNKTSIADEARARELRSLRPTTVIRCELPGCGAERTVTVHSGKSLPRTCSLRHRVALSRLERRMRLEREAQGATDPADD